MTIGVMKIVLKNGIKTQTKKAKDLEKNLKNNMKQETIHTLLVLVLALLAGLYVSCVCQRDNLMNLEEHCEVYKELNIGY